MVFKNMVKPLTFKGDKKSRKRKAGHSEVSDEFAKRQIGSELEILTPGNIATKTDVSDNWVSAEAVTDITGPILITLPSVKPSCIACDANGKIFISELENVVEGNLSTAEPHDVRQVWIANRVAGTEAFSMKGHHGCYLSCDIIGRLSATREAISSEESFLCIPSQEDSGTFSIRTAQDKYLTLVGPFKDSEIRGDAESVSTGTECRIRMQAQFKPSLKKDKEQKVSEKVSKKELEEAAGRSLDHDEVKKLKKARVRGNYHEAMLDIRAKGKHDKYS